MQYRQYRNPDNDPRSLIGSPTKNIDMISQLYLNDHPTRNYQNLDNSRVSVREMERMNTPPQNKKTNLKYQNYGYSLETPEYKMNLKKSIGDNGDYNNRLVGVNKLVKNLEQNMDKLQNQNI